MHVVCECEMSWDCSVSEYDSNIYGSGNWTYKNGKGAEA